MSIPRPFSASRLARWWVLAWFIASVTGATASVLVNPQSLAVICTGSGAIKWLAQTDDGAAEMDATGMDCPLCAQAHGAPPPAPQPLPLPASPLAHAVQPISAARIAAATAAPLPARGPPSLL